MQGTAANKIGVDWRAVRLWRNGLAASIPRLTVNLVKPVILAYNTDSEWGMSGADEFELIAAFGDEECGLCGESFERWDNNWHNATDCIDYHVGCVNIKLVENNG